MVLLVGRLPCLLADDEVADEGSGRDVEQDRRAVRIQCQRLRQLTAKQSLEVSLVGCGTCGKWLTGEDQGKKIEAREQRNLVLLSNGEYLTWRPVKDAVVYTSGEGRECRVSV